MVFLDTEDAWNAITISIQLLQASIGRSQCHVFGKLGSRYATLKAIFSSLYVEFYTIHLYNFLKSRFYYSLKLYFASIVNDFKTSDVHHQRIIFD